MQVPAGAEAGQRPGRGRGPAGAAAAVAVGSAAGGTGAAAGVAAASRPVPAWIGSVAKLSCTREQCDGVSCDSNNHASRYCFARISNQQAPTFPPTLVAMSLNIQSIINKPKETNRS